jgi:hypothetical protein
MFQTFLRIHSILGDKCAVYGEHEMVLNRMTRGFALTLLNLSLSAAAQATTHINPAINSSYLGMGVSSVDGVLRGNCIIGDNVETGNTSVNLSLQNTTTAQQSIREVKGKFSADVNLGLFAAGASVSFHTRLEENSNTASMVYRVKYRASTQTLENRNYTELGLSVHGQTPQQTRASCGDEFIDSVTLGSDLYLVTQMQFSSKEEYEKFVTKIKVRVLFWSSTTTISNETYDFAQNGVYSVKALSTLPLPPDITAILGGSGEKHCNVNNNDMPACVSAANDVLDYLVGINSSYGNYLTNPANLTVTSFNSMPYATAGHFELASSPQPLDATLASLQDQLMTLLNDNRVKQNIAQAFGAVPGQNQNAFLALLTTININITALETALDSCRANPVTTHCQSATDTALALQVNVNVDVDL